MTTAIAAAVLPLKADAIGRAEMDAKATVASMTVKLEAVGWDLERLAPYPRSSDASYHSKIRARRFYDGLTKCTAVSRRPHDPCIVVIDNARVAKFIEDAKTDAALQYDAFVMKLEVKVGAHVNAVLKGNHVWGRSLLTVTTAEGEVQKWRTQQIVNVSKLGRLFNQWPTRKVK